MSQNRSDQISVLLTALEEAASVPVVPGELRAWCETAGNAFGALGEHWVRKDEELQSTFAQIENDDMELAPRVQRMRKKRRSISVEFVRLEQVFAKLLKFGSDDPQSSAELTGMGEALRQDVLQLALRCRTLEKEAATWAIEATYRDRGIGD